MALRKEYGHPMSYCRWSDVSDLYIYDDGNTFVCLCCELGERHSTFDAIIAHVEQHIALGHTVMPHVLPTLNEEKIRYARYLG